MYAEISIHFAEPINRARLFAGMPPCADHRVALAHTVFSTTPDLAAAAVCSRVMPSTVFVVFEFGADSLRIHVENTVDRGSIAKLKGAAEEVARTLSDAGKRAQCKCDEVVIRIHAEENLMQEGRRVPIGQLLYRRFRERILGSFLIGVRFTVMSLLLGIDAKKSLVAQLD